MNPQVKTSQGFVFVTTGENYRREAAQAAARIRITTPGSKICIVTDVIEGPVFWDEAVVLAHPTFSFRDKIAMRLCPYNKVFYLDTDVYALEDLSEVFQLLDRFDFAGHQLFEGHDCPLPGIPDAFCEIQGGVLAFRNTPRAQEFFDCWEKNYDAFRSLNKNDYYHYSNVSDQKSLRKSFYESGLSLAVLGPEYDFTPHHVNFACAPVRILHGRGEANLQDLARRLNHQLGNRVYIPSLDSVISNYPPLHELWRLWIMAGLQLLRRLAQITTPLALRNRLRQLRSIRHLVLGTKFGDAEQPSGTKWD